MLKKKKNIKITSLFDLDNYINSLMKATFKVLDVVFLRVLKLVLKEVENLLKTHAKPDKLQTWTEINKHKRLKKMLKRVSQMASKEYSKISKEIEEMQHTIYSEEHNAKIFLTEKETQKEIDFDVPSEKEIQKAIEQPIDKIKLNETLERHRKQVIKNIQKCITEGLLKGDDYSTIANEIMKEKYQVEPWEALYDHTKPYIENKINMAKSQALRVARTELARAKSQALLDSAQVIKDNGLDIKKRWHATLDTRTRHDHRTLDGQVKELDEPFKINGCVGQAPVLFVGPNSASENINCRCTLLTFVDEDELPTSRRARDDEGKTYVIDDMTYREWEEWKKKRKTSA